MVAAGETPPGLHVVQNPQYSRMGPFPPATTLATSNIGAFLTLWSAAPFLDLNLDDLATNRALNLKNALDYWYSANLDGIRKSLSRLPHNLYPGSPSSAIR